MTHSFPVFRTRAVAHWMAAALAFTVSCQDPKGSGGGGKTDAADDDGVGDADGDGPSIQPLDLEPAADSCLPGRNDCPDGEKCQPYVSTPGECCVDAAQCVPLTGSKAVGEACTRGEAQDDCARDVFCFAGTSEKTGSGLCKQLCDAENPESCSDFGLPNATCVPYNDGVLPMCETACHPLRPDSCQAGQGCYPGGGGFNCHTPDPQPGMGKDHDDCHTVQSCGAGLYCASGAVLDACTSDSCCTTFCDVTATDGAGCLDPETCVPLFDDENAAPDPALDDVGGCQVADGQ